MIRFSVTVTCVEILLTLGAALFVTFSETGEPFLSEAEFRTLGIPVEKLTTEKRSRFGALYSYDTNAVVKDSGPAVYISVRVNTPREEYDSREAGERQPKTREDGERPIINDESWPDEPGYAVRHRGRNGVRAEIVRLHAKDLLIVRSVWLNVPEANRAQAAAHCEHLARLIQERLAQRLGWRE